MPDEIKVFQDISYYEFLTESFLTLYLVSYKKILVMNIFCLWRHQLFDDVIVTLVYYDLKKVLTFGKHI